MLVEIDDALFAAEHSGQHTTVTHILLSCLSSRHGAVIVPEVAQFADWLKEQNEQLAANLIELVLASSRAANAWAPRHTIRVTSGNNVNWNTPVPFVTATEALRLLNEPFHICVEDAVSDRAFVLSYSSQPQREFLEERERSGFVAFDHGGGLNRLLDRLKQFSARFHRPELICAAIIDGDAWQPGNPSNESEQVRLYCVSRQIHCLQLSRRNIENYLTKQALRYWTFSRGTAMRRRYQPVFEAFLTLNGPQRAHYNMRGGFTADARAVGRSAGTLYNGVSPATAAALASGFSRQVTSCFTDGWVTESDARRDNTWPEMSGPLDAIYRLI